jgi:hypothetical protein
MECNGGCATRHMYQSGRISSWRRHIKSDANNCNNWNVSKGLWTGTQMTNLRISSTSPKKQTLNKLNHPQSWWSFWHMMSKVFLCVIPFQGVGLWMHSITSHFSSTTYTMQYGRSIHSWFKMPSSYMIMLQPTQQTLWNMLSELGLGSVRTAFLTCVHVTVIWSPNWTSDCERNNMQRGRAF